MPNDVKAIVSIAEHIAKWKMGDSLIQQAAVLRLVLSALLELDGKGKVLSSSFCKGVIRSAHRMTYTEVARLLGSETTSQDAHRYGAFLQDFRTMADLAVLLRRRREGRGSIDFDLPDADVVLDDAGLVVGIVPESRNIAHRHRLLSDFLQLLGLSKRVIHHDVEGMEHHISVPTLRAIAALTGLLRRQPALRARLKSAV